MKKFRPDYEFPIADRARARSAGQPAGVFYLEGRVHFAAEHTAAHEELVQRGALLVAQLRFDRPVAPLAGAPVDPITVAEALRRFTGTDTIARERRESLLDPTGGTNR